MAKVKLTKTALKQQRDNLKQFLRFLPTLQLKKQQLQVEMRQCLEHIARNEEHERQGKKAIASWIGLFGSEKEALRVADTVRIQKIDTDFLNIAGVEVPRFQGVVFENRPYDLFLEDLWFDDAVAAVKRIVELRIERAIVRRQFDLIRQELLVTTQRVNLFEKIKIPECRENIRTIQIYLGDMDTSSVARSKIAKKKLREAVA